MASLTLDRLTGYLEHLNKYSKPVDTNSASDSESETDDDVFDTILPKGHNKNGTTFPVKFVDILGDLSKNCHRIGTPQVWINRQKKEKTQQNISLFYSVLYCLKTNFIEMGFPEQVSFISTLIQKMSIDLAREKLYSKLKYSSMGMRKGILIDDLKGYRNTPSAVQYLADYFNVNILVFDFTNDKVYAYYMDKFYNSFRQTIILVQIDSYFEPLIYKNKTQFSYKHQIIKNIVDICEDSITVPRYSSKSKIKHFYTSDVDLDVMKKKFCKDDEKKKDKYEETALEDNPDILQTTMESDYESNNDPGVDDSDGSDDDSSMIAESEEEASDEDSDIDIDDIIVSSDDDRVTLDDLNDSSSDSEYDSDNSEGSEIAVAPAEESGQSDESDNESESANDLDDESEDESEDESGDESEDEQVVKPTMKMKKPELQQLAKKYGISLKNGKKDKTKQVLCDEITLKQK